MIDRVPEINSDGEKVDSLALPSSKALMMLDSLS
jgi:hypothetical protein